jgi:chromosome segregation ATPase
MNIENRLLEVVELIAERVGETNAKLGTLETKLGSRIDETNAKIDEGLGKLEAKLGSRIDETNAKLGTLETSLGSRIDETNARLGTVETRLGAKIDETNARLDENNARLGTLEATSKEHSVLLRQLNSGLAETNVRLGRVESHVGGCERGLDHVNEQLDTLKLVFSEDYRSLTVRADESDNRIDTLEMRVDKLEEAG